ncbi:MAG: hypothetical protein GC145_19375 [Caulobacter sp.]|nr:hypothetical protein [Caulobacter sp.]
MNTNDTGGAASSALELFSAKDLRAITERKYREQATAELRRMAAEEQEKKHQQEMFFRSGLTPEFINLVMTRVRTAAESGATEIMIGQFPSDWCTDGGRKINEPEDDWPDTLQGVAKEFFEFWQQNLKPRGFHLKAQIITFPGGLLGDVGAYLSWDDAGQGGDHV